MLGRAGIAAVLVDPHQAYPKDFRCEKLDAAQIELLRKTGLADPVLRVATPDLEVWIARFGRLSEKRPNGQVDLLYDTLVNTMGRRFRRASNSSAPRPPRSRPAPTASG